MATNIRHHADTLRRSHRHEQRRRSFYRRVLWYWLAAVVLMAYTVSQVVAADELRPSVVFIIVCWIGWLLSWPKYPHGR